ncbi:VOC family protein [Martelella mediterranea]|nr:VOC family protein [Martelella mediterranea]
MPFEKRINLVTLGVSDLKEATAFYERLGWKRSSASSEAITFIALDGLVLGLFPRDELAADAGIGAPERPKGFSGITLAHNVRSEAEVDQMLAFAATCGATITKQAEKVFWGGYSGYFADPDGHLWEVAFNPLAPLDDEGRMQLPD